MVWFRGIGEDPNAFADILALLYGMPLKAARFICFCGATATERMCLQVTHAEMKRWCARRWWPTLALSKDLQLPDIEAGLRTATFCESFASTWHKWWCAMCFAAQENDS